MQCNPEIVDLHFYIIPYNFLLRRSSPYFISLYLLLHVYFFSYLFVLLWSEVVISWSWCYTALTFTCSIYVYFLNHSFNVPMQLFCDRKDKIPIQFTYTCKASWIRVIVMLCNVSVCQVLENLSCVGCSVHGPLHDVRPFFLIWLVGSKDLT